MRNILFVAYLLIFSGSGFAFNCMSCEGRNIAGRYVYLTSCAGESVVNINGDVLRIVGKTRDGQGVVTENFRTTNGYLVYDSLVPTSNTTLNIYQFNAVTEALLDRAALYCSFIGNHIANAKVSESSIFSSKQ